ncbi:MAG: GNAT family N-acetyltransferase, partial [Chloroflexi bacterium]
MNIRSARIEDVEDMRALIARYANEDRMLERSRDFLVERLRDYVVADDDDAFQGCCALAVLTPDLAE